MGCSSAAVSVTAAAELRAACRPTAAALRVTVMATLPACCSRRLLRGGGMRKGRSEGGRERVKERGHQEMRETESVEGDRGERAGATVANGRRVKGSGRRSGAGWYEGARKTAVYGEKLRPPGTGYKRKGVGGEERVAGGGAWYDTKRHCRKARRTAMRERERVGREREGKGEGERHALARFMPLPLAMLAAR